MQSKPRIHCRTAIITLTLGAILSIAPARLAHAYGDGAFAAGAIMVWLTYLTTKGVICTPVAAIKASDHAQGFRGAFKACWDWRLDVSGSESAPPTEEIAGATNAPNLREVTGTDTASVPDHEARSEDPTTPSH